MKIEVGRITLTAVVIFSFAVRIGIHDLMCENSWFARAPTGLEVAAPLGQSERKAIPSFHTATGYKAQLVTREFL